jgi:hypothetical protein
MTEVTELDVDQKIVYDGKVEVVLLGKARRQDDGTWRCLANYCGALVIMEVKVKFDEPPEWVGNPTYERFKRLDLDDAVEKSEASIEHIKARASRLELD